MQAQPSLKYVGLPTKVPTTGLWNWTSWIILDHPGHPGTDCSALVAEASLARTGQEYFAIPAGFVVKSPRNHGFLLRLELGLPVFLGEEKNKT